MTEKDTRQDQADDGPQWTGRAFDRFDVTAGSSPILISVPHSGRVYPPELLAHARLAVSQMRMLEDRHADALVQPLIDAGHAGLIALAPRAMIDLNRDERDVDTRLVRGIPHGTATIESVKQRGGLGLFPRSLPQMGELWQRSLDWSEATRRITDIHRPYHGAIEEMMNDLFALHGTVLLLDVHSMPPLLPGRVTGLPPDIVIGDRFGASAGSRLSETARHVATTHGLNVALNHPYAGSYLLDRHGAPMRNRHALQIEVSRALYLDSGFDKITTGLGRMQAFMSALVEALSDELSGQNWAEAAE